jgi:hypothetical protein
MPPEGLSAHVESPMVIAAATEAPRREGAHAVGAHVAEGRGVRARWVCSAGAGGGRTPLLPQSPDQNI